MIGLCFIGNYGVRPHGAFSVPHFVARLLVACSVFLWRASATLLAQEASYNYRLIETINVLDKFHLPSSSTPKPCSIGIDAVRGLAYISSQQSQQFPVINIDSVQQQGFLNVPFTPNGDELALLVNPYQNVLYLYTARAERDSLKTLSAINIKTQQLITTATYRVGIQDIALERSGKRLFLADDNILRVFDAATLRPLDTLVLGFSIGGIALDSTNKRIFLTSRDVQHYQQRLVSYSFMPPYTLLKTSNISTSVALPKMFLDTNWNRMLIVGTQNARVLQLGTNVTVKHIAFGGTYQHAVYSPAVERLFVASENGASAQGDGGNYGKMLAIGSVKDIRDSVRLGMRVTALALDESRGRLLTVAEQQGAVQFYQTSSLKSPQSPPSVDITRSFDDIAVSPDGATVFVSNRYGAKSRVFAYTFVSQEAVEMPSGAWTTALVVDSARSRLFGLAQQENMIYIFSTVTNSYIGKTPIFGYKELRSDALSAFSFDRTKQKLYITMPENKVAIDIDLFSATTEKALKVLGYTFSPHEITQGALQIAFLPETNKLCVLRTQQKMLNIYNLINNTLTDSINLAAKWTPAMDVWSEKLLFYHPLDKILFVGGIALDVENRRSEPRIIPNMSRILGMNAKQTTLFGIAKQENALVLQECNPQTLAVSSSRILFSSKETLAPLVHFDTKRNHLLTLERASGLLRRYDVNSLSTAAPIVQKPDTTLTTLSIYPNPIISQATVRFGVRMKEKVKLTVVDTQGREVAVLTEAEYEPGTHTITLKIENDNYAAATYFVHLKSPTMNYNKIIHVQQRQ
ncbi:MAG: hypothetical protein EAZ92_12230 [Candidatus Kapaibacterium sp.]|nr:MAG: hypothetical protein EAZ92_12230 [Candidatus Kapabacteria bacterium]